MGLYGSVAYMHKERIIVNSKYQLLENSEYHRKVLWYGIYDPIWIYVVSSLDECFLSFGSVNCQFTANAKNILNRSLEDLKYFSLMFPLISFRTEASVQTCHNRRWILCWSRIYIHCWVINAYVHIPLFTRLEYFFKFMLASAHWNL